MKLLHDGMTDMLRHWHRLAAWQQTVLLGGCCLLALYFPALHYWQQCALADSLTQQLQTQRETLSHQQKILAALKGNETKQLLTPELASKLPPINRQIQQLAGKLQIEHSRWDFRRKPLLTLRLLGHFNDLHEFLTALLSANDELEFVQWHIVKEDGQNGAVSIHSDLLLQLNIKEK